MIKQALVMILAIALLGCQNMYKRDRDAYRAGYSQVQLGNLAADQIGFDEYTLAQNKMKAPHDQVYFFNFDDSTLSAEDVQSVIKQANYLVKHRGAKIFIAGHTCERGSPQYNLGLGERRANSVVEILRLNGVEGGQIEVVSYGHEKPVVRDHNEVAYRQNRRVELEYRALR